MAKAPPTPLAQAKRILGAQYAPVDYAARQAAARSSQEQAALNASRAALVALLQSGVKPAGDVYDSAVNQQQALAKGAADLLAQQNPNPQVQADLSAVNAPPEQHALLRQALQAGFPGAGAVLNVEQGTVPGASLLAQKAAEQGYLAGLPTVAALSGEQSLRGLLAKGEDQQNALTEQRLQIGGQLPSLVHTLTGEAQSRHQQVLDNAYRTSQAQAEAAYRQQDLAFRARESALDRAAQAATTPYQQAQIDLERQRIANERQNAKANRATPQIIGSAGSGYYTVDPNTGKVTQILGPSGAGKGAKGTKGLTPYEIQRYKGQAYTVAQQAFKGVDEQGNRINSDGSRVSYNDALHEMRARGIPINLAVQALNSLYPVKYRVTQRGTLVQSGAKKGKQAQPYPPGLQGPVG